MAKTWWISSAELDADQQAVLQLPADGRYIVTGPPGCGKSNLLVLRGKYLQGLKKENFRILAFQQPLVRFLRASNAVSDDKITTAMKWLDDQLWQLEGRRIVEKDFKTKRQKVAKAVADHLETHGISGLVHALLVDEMQDYSTSEIALFSRIAEHLFLVGDVRQQIYPTDTSRTSLSNLAGDFRVVKLERHYRIGPKICMLADLLAKPDRGHKKITAGCCYDDGGNPSSVDRVRADEIVQLGKIVERCRKQLLTFPNELLGVLCPTNEVLARAIPFLEREFGSKLTVQRSGGYEDFDISRPIVLSTMHGSKGLEYRCVHVPAACALKGMPRSRELIYTSVTRAKTSVSIYHSGSLNDFLEDALRELEPPPTPPTLDSLFE